MFGIEAGNGFGSVVSSEHEQLMLSCDGVLHRHAHASFDVAPLKIGNWRRVELIDCIDASVDGWCDVQAQVAIGFYKVESGEGILFICLTVIRKAKGPKGLVISCFFPGLLHSELGEFAAQCRVLTAANTKYVTVCSRSGEVCC